MNTYEKEFDKKCVVASYTKAGKLKAVKMKRGELVLPELIGVVGANEEEARVIMKPTNTAEDTKLFNEAKRLWMEFYKSRAQVAYRFSAADGVALKSILAHLNEQSGGGDVSILW